MAEEEGDPGKEAGDEWEWRLIVEVDPCPCPLKGTVVRFVVLEPMRQLRPSGEKLLRWKVELEKPLFVLDPERLPLFPFPFPLPLEEGVVQLQQFCGLLFPNPPSLPSGLQQPSGSGIVTVMASSNFRFS